MVGSIPGMEGKPMPPEMNPDLNGPIVAFLASDLAAHVNGQIFGRRGYAYTLFQTPKPIAALYKEGGFTASEIAKNFDAVFREHLSVPGIPPTPALQPVRVRRRHQPRPRPARHVLPLRLRARLARGARGEARRADCEGRAGEPRRRPRVDEVDLLQGPERPAARVRVLDARAGRRRCAHAGALHREPARRLAGDRLPGSVSPSRTLTVAWRHADHGRASRSLAPPRLRRRSE